MVKIFLVFTLVVSSVSISLSQAATLVLGLRGSNASLETICKTCSKLDVIEADAKEFANGNTFVRFIQPVAQQNVVVYVPKIIDANQFMELLIKIRTAQANFARSVSVAIHPSSGSIEVRGVNGNLLLDPAHARQLIAKAGANNLAGVSLASQNIENTSVNQRNPKVLKSAIVDMGTNSTLARNVSVRLGLPIVLATEQKEQLIKGQVNHAIVVSSVADPHNESFLTALGKAQQISKAGIRVTLLTPYLPYARSDKMDQNGVAVIGRLAADMIESSGVAEAQFVRAHAPQSQGFFRIPTIQTMGRGTINRYLRSVGIEQVISPDAGFQKDATLYADDLKVPVAVINKQRDLQTGESKLHDMSGPSVTGKVVAIIDDETASGGTLKKAAEFLKANGAKKVIAVVTHLAGDAAQAVTSPHIDEMVVTDTFEVKVANPKLKVLSLADEVSADLRRMLNPAPRCSRAYDN